MQEFPVETLLQDFELFDQNRETRSYEDFGMEKLANASELPWWTSNGILQYLGRTGDKTEVFAR